MDALLGALAIFSPFIIIGLLGCIASLIDWAGKKHTGQAELEQNKQKLQKEQILIRQEKDQLFREKHSFEYEKKNLILEKLQLQKTQDYYEERIKEIDTIAKLKLDGIPYFSEIMSDFLLKHYEESAYYLEHKRRPAIAEAKRINELKKETREYVKQLKTLEYKLKYIEALFPNINDLFDNEFNATEDFELETDETTDRVRYYLSPEEYRALSTSEKNQLALDRYVEGRKSKWQIGRDYEMYIGQLFEQKGFRVEYTGIIENLEDMGRDLIASSSNNTYIVQCKNWSREKTIHEKHIFQLYGTMILKTLETPNSKVSGMFVTSTLLSKKAKEIAKYLDIGVYEKIPLQDFPRIKCNISERDGEKIYHLPFDQQYEKTVIDQQKGEFYALTVAEAEAQGYRRAFRYYGE